MLIPGRTPRPPARCAGQPDHHRVPKVQLHAAGARCDQGRVRSDQPESVRRHADVTDVTDITDVTKRRKCEHTTDQHTRRPHGLCDGARGRESESETAAVRVGRQCVGQYVGRVHTVPVAALHRPAGPKSHGTLLLTCIPIPARRADRHLYFKSAFIMNHPMGKWRYAQRHVQNLVPVPEVARMLIADRNMVGLHVRNVFDGASPARRSRRGVTSVTSARRSRRGTARPGPNRAVPRAQPAIPSIRTAPPFDSIGHARSATPDQPRPISHALSVTLRPARRPQRHVMTRRTAIRWGVRRWRERRSSTAPRARANYWRGGRHRIGPTSCRAFRLSCASTASGGR